MADLENQNSPIDGDGQKRQRSRKARDPKRYNHQEGEDVVSNSKIYQTEPEDLSRPVAEDLSSRPVAAVESPTSSTRMLNENEVKSEVKTEKASSHSPVSTTTLKQE